MWVVILGDVSCGAGAGVAAGVEVLDFLSFFSLRCFEDCIELAKKLAHEETPPYLLHLLYFLHHRFLPIATIRVARRRDCSCQYTANPKRRAPYLLSSPSSSGSASALFATRVVVLNLAWWIYGGVDVGSEKLRIRGRRECDWLDGSCCRGNFGYLIAKSYLINT